MGLCHNTQVMGRWFRFLFVLLVGLAAGLLYGWLINPVKYIDTTPDSLRADYKTDYVLMTAESYHDNGDLALAARRLALLGDSPPIDFVRQSMMYASQVGYAEADLNLLGELATDLQSWNPLQNVGSP